MMADSNGNTVPNLDLNSIMIFNSCQDMVAAFTMLSADHDEYESLINEFSDRVIPREDFRLQMEALFLRSPQYANVRVFWDIVFRHIAGNGRWDDRELILFPLVTLYLFEIFLGDFIEPDRQAVETQQYILWPWFNRECRYMDGIRPTRNPDTDDHLERYFVSFLFWCADRAASATMPPSVYGVLQRTASDFCIGRATHLLGLGGPTPDLLDAEYGTLYAWWNLLHAEATTGVPARDSPRFISPLTRCVRMEISDAATRRARWISLFDEFPRRQ